MCCSPIVVEVTEAFNELLQMLGDVNELSKSQLERCVWCKVNLALSCQALLIGDG